MRIKAELVYQQRWDWTYGSCTNTYKCPCGQDCIRVKIDCTPGIESRIAYFDTKYSGTCHLDFSSIVEDYNSFELTPRTGE